MDNLRLIGSYLNAKVKSLLTGEIVDCSTVLGWILSEVPPKPLEITQWELQLRSLDSITEQEAKDYLISVGAEKFTLSNPLEYFNSYYLIESGLDWMRSKNFITEFEGKDIIELGYATINNEAYG